MFYRCLFVCLISLSVSTSSTAYSAEKPYGYISYYTWNIGDDIQALAARQFLPKDAIPINRDYISQFKNDVSVKTLFSGWFMQTKSCWFRNDKKAPEVSWPLLIKSIH